MKLVSGVRGEMGVRNLYKDIEKLEEEILFWKGRDKEFERVLRYIKKVVSNVSYKMTEVEKVELMQELVHNYITFKLLQERKKIKIDMIEVIDLTVNTNSFDAVYDYMLLNEREKLLKYEVLTRNVRNLFVEKGDIDIDIEKKDRAVIQITHKKKRIAKYYKRINSVRMPSKLLEILDTLREETATISTLINNLLIEFDVHQIEPADVVKFNTRLKEKHPYLYTNKKNVTVTVMVQAYYRWLVYRRKANIRQKSNKDKEVIGLSGLLYYIIFGKKYKTLLSLF